MSLSTREQLWAFVALIGSILILGLAPVVVAGWMEKALPDNLIAVSDKTVTGLVGVLGTIAAMIFRTNRVDEARAENTGKALDAISAVAATSSPAKADILLEPGDTAKVAAVPETAGATDIIE